MALVCIYLHYTARVVGLEEQCYCDVWLSDMIWCMIDWFPSFKIYMVPTHLAPKCICVSMYRCELTYGSSQKSHHCYHHQPKKKIERSWSFGQFSPSPSIHPIPSPSHPNPSFFFLSLVSIFTNFLFIRRRMNGLSWIDVDTVIDSLKWIPFPSSS